MIKLLQFKIVEKFELYLIKMQILIECRVFSSSGSNRLSRSLTNSCENSTNMKAYPEAKSLHYIGGQETTRDPKSI